MAVRQAHRRVEVVGTGKVGAFEDRHDEARVDDVEDVGDGVCAAQRGDSLCVGRVDLRGDESLVGDARDQRLGAITVVVGHDDAVVEVATGGDERRRRTDATSADDEDPHGEFRFERGVIPLITPLQRTVWHKMLI